MGVHCKVHRAQIRRGSVLPHPCRRCGVGTQSEAWLCKPCGMERGKKRLVRIEVQVRRRFPLLMSELVNRAGWSRQLPEFVGL